MTRRRPGVRIHLRVFRAMMPARAVPEVREKTGCPSSQPHNGQRAEAASEGPPTAQLHPRLTSFDAPKSRKPSYEPSCSCLGASSRRRPQIRTQRPTRKSPMKRLLSATCPGSSWRTALLEPLCVKSWECPPSPMKTPSPSSSTSAESTHSGLTTPLLRKRGRKGARGTSRTLQLITCGRAGVCANPPVGRPAVMKALVS